MKPLTEGWCLHCQQRAACGTTATTHGLYHNSVSFAPLDSCAHMAKHHPAAKDDQKETMGELTCHYIF